mgnify:CR=1 FL=1
MDEMKHQEIGTLESNGRQPWILPVTPFKWQTKSDCLADLAGCLSPITLDEMERVALLNRQDTKYVVTNSRLLAALQSLQNDYRILSINGKRLNHYRSRFPSRACYGY